MVKDVVATPEERVGVEIVVHPLPFLLYWNVTVPVGVPAEPETVTLNVTDEPRLIGPAGENVVTPTEAVAWFTVKDVPVPDAAMLL